MVAAFVYEESASMSDPLEVFLLLFRLLLEKRELWDGELNRLRILENIPWVDSW